MFTASTLGACLLAVATIAPTAQAAAPAAAPMASVESLCTFTIATKPYGRDDKNYVMLNARDKAKIRACARGVDSNYIISSSRHDRNDSRTDQYVENAVAKEFARHGCYFVNHTLDITVSKGSEGSQCSFIVQPFGHDYPQTDTLNAHTEWVTKF